MLSRQKRLYGTRGHQNTMGYSCAPSRASKRTANNFASAIRVCLSKDVSRMVLGTDVLSVWSPRELKGSYLSASCISTALSGTSILCHMAIFCFQCAAWVCSDKERRKATGGQTRASSGLQHPGLAAVQLHRESMWRNYHSKLNHIWQRTSDNIQVISDKTHPNHHT